MIQLVGCNLLQRFVLFEAGQYAPTLSNKSHPCRVSLNISRHFEIK